MTVGAADVVTPMLATTEVVVFFSSCMTGQTSFGDLFRRLVLEGDDLCWVTLLAVGFPRAMTSLTSGNLVFPTVDVY